MKESLRGAGGNVATMVMNALLDSASVTFWVRKAPTTESSTEHRHWRGSNLRSPSTPLSGNRLTWPPFAHSKM